MRCQAAEAFERDDDEGDDDDNMGSMDDIPDDRTDVDMDLNGEGSGAANLEGGGGHGVITGWKVLPAKSSAQ